MVEHSGKIHLVTIDSDISVDDWNEGVGESTGAGLSGTPIGRTFANMDEAMKYLSDYYGLSKNAVEYEDDGKSLQTSKQVANHSEAQNGGWFEPTEAEIASWKDGRLKLYSEDFTIRYILTN